MVAMVTHFRGRGNNGCHGISLLDTWGASGCNGDSLLEAEGTIVVMVTWRQREQWLPCDSFFRDRGNNGWHGNFVRNSRYNSCHGASLFETRETNGCHGDSLLGIGGTMVVMITYQGCHGDSLCLSYQGIPLVL